MARKGLVVPMKKVANYKVIFDQNVAILADKVNGLLIDGWQPFGPPFTDSSSDCVFQCMVLYEEDLL